MGMRALALAVAVVLASGAVASASVSSDAVSSDLGPIAQFYDDAPGYPSQDFRAFGESDVEGYGEFSLGIGWVRMNFDGNNELIDDRDGIHFDPVFSIAPFEALPQLRFGAAVGVSVALDDVRGAVISRGGQLVVISGGDVSLFLIEPELRISWRQYFGPEKAYFLEAGGGGGGVFGWLDAGDGDDDESEDADDVEETASALMAKVFLRFGARVTGGLGGIEVSYLRGGNMDFAEGIEGDVSTFYLGVFGALQF